MAIPKPPKAIVGAALLLSTAPAVAQSLPSAAPMPPSAVQSLPSAAPTLRELTTDRPDTTESPFTINAGHLQIETTLFGYARSPRDNAGNRAESVEVGTTNFRLGLTDRLEVNLVVRPYGLVAPGGGARQRSGVGAVDLRAKYNLWGDDGGRTALAILPYLSIPTDRSTGLSPPDIDYGVLVPLSIDLGGRLGLGLNAGLNVRRPDSGLPYRVSVPLTASFAVAWSDRIGGYYEIASEVAGGEAAAVSLNTGITWLATKSLQLDTGIGFGVAGSADRIAPFMGISARF